MPEADVKAVDEDEASEGCDASELETEACEAPPAQGKNKKTDFPTQNVAIGDIVWLSLQRNKPRYDGYEAQCRLRSTPRPFSRCSATFLVAQSRLPTPGREFARGICSPAHTPLQCSKAPRGASSSPLSMYDTAVATGAARSN